MNLGKSYLRWRHSKGFGVHSPFAYRFVTNVINPGRYHYYSYHEIDKELLPGEYHNHRLLKLIRFTIRLAIFLKSKRILNYNSAFRMPVIAAHSLGLKYETIGNTHKFSFQHEDLLVINEDFRNLEFLRLAVENGVPVFALKPVREIRKFLEIPLSRGLLLDAGNRIILIPREEMAYVAYDISLPLR